MSTADAVARETAWLNTPGGGLPTLPASGGGPWGVVQGYWPRTPSRRAGGQLYVVRTAIHEKRFANQRLMYTHMFALRLVWPLSSGSGNAEADQQSFDNAIELVLQKVRAYQGDKTHGGRFLSVAENPPEVTVQFEDPARYLASEAEFRATISYHADDVDQTG
ncbi:MAG: hypothetical protein ACREQ5_00070 [Candidatus Dormibacteria bacterium]